MSIATLPCTFALRGGRVADEPAVNCDGLAGATTATPMLCAYGGPKMIVIAHRYACFAAGSGSALVSRLSATCSQYLDAEEY